MGFVQPAPADLTIILLQVECIQYIMKQLVRKSTKCTSNETMQDRISHRPVPDPFWPARFNGL